ncbi:pathogenesis-related protein 1-like [Rutidosis leptorrhynchoides]|uniref:pathogenesis-related protein 1-like n=1 Tax=Rutidosis leptorrhynchoides TaxID=125765 RepID=UPI003A997D76
MGHWCSISFFLFLSIAILNLCDAHGPGNCQEDYVQVHNCIRKVLNLPCLKYDPALEKSAQEWADQRKDCALIHSTGPVGENMAYGPELNITYAVQLWLDERLDYKYSTNECLQMCGHYTQIVWKNTERVGCARSLCDRKDGGWTYYTVVCQYDPPGNVVGQWPY